MNRSLIALPVLLLLGFFRMPFCEAQVAPSGISVHIEPQHLYMGGLKTVAELPVKNNLRVAAGLYTYFGKPYHEMLRDSVTYHNFSGLGFSIMPKLYLGRSEAEYSNNHFYLAAYGGYRNWRAEVAEFNWAEVQRPDQLYYLEFLELQTRQKIKRTDFGAGIGLHREYRRSRVVLDVFAGAGHSNTKIASGFPVIRYHTQEANHQADYRYSGLYFALQFQVGYTFSEPAQASDEYLQ